MGGGPLTRGATFAFLTTLLVGAGCGAAHQYRDYTLPAMFAPDAPADAKPTDPIALAEEDSRLLDGGIKLIRADRAVPSPDFSLTDDTGGTHSLASLAGRVVWIDLWAEWCGTCRAEFPSIQKLHERYVAQGLSVLGVCRNSSKRGFEQAVRKDWLSFTMADASGDRSFPFPYGAFPTSVILDRAGRVRSYWQGHRPLSGVEELLRLLLAESPTGEERGTTPVVRAEDLPGPRGSESVVKASLALPRQLSPGDLLDATVVLDLDPGWYVTTHESEGSVPFRLELESDGGLRSLDFLEPGTVRRRVAGEHRDVYAGTVEFPVWGVVDESVASGRGIPLQIVATVQACDASSCLAPSRIELSGEVWVTD